MSPTGGAAAFGDDCAHSAPGGQTREAVAVGTSPAQAEEGIPRSQGPRVDGDAPESPPGCFDVNKLPVGDLAGGINGHIYHNNMYARQAR